MRLYVLRLSARCSRCHTFYQSYSRVPVISSNAVFSSDNAFASTTHPQFSTWTPSSIITGDSFIMKVFSPDSVGVGTTMYFFNWTHSLTGLPWWATILLMAWSYHLLTLPIWLTVDKNAYTRKILRQKELAIIEQLKLEQRQNYMKKSRLSEKQMASAINERKRKLWQKYNYHPWKKPLWFSFTLTVLFESSMAILNLCGAHTININIPDGVKDQLFSTLKNMNDEMQIESFQLMSCDPSIAGIFAGLLILRRFSVIGFSYISQSALANEMVKRGVKRPESRSKMLNRAAWVSSIIVPTSVFLFFSHVPLGLTLFWMNFYVGSWTKQILKRFYTSLKLKYY